MKSNAQITEIDPQDIDSIESLWNDLKHHHQQRSKYYNEYYLSNTFDKRKAKLLAKDNLAVFVAHNNGERVGFCIVSVNSCLGEIDSLFVKPAYRERKIGEGLGAAGMSWLTERKPDSIRLSVGQGNEDVLSFYRKLGFKERATIMEFFA